MISTKLRERRLGPTARLLAAVGLLVVLCSVVFACGAKAEKDSLVGTWRLWPGHGPDSQTPLIITKNGQDYVATVVYWGPGDEPASPRPTLPVSLKRSGDRLTGTFTKNGKTVRVTMLYEPASGHLTFANSTRDGPMTKPAVFVKVSDGTAYPTTP